MATTPTPTSSSGSIRRLIGIHRKTLIRRLAALNEAIRTSTGVSEEELEDDLTDSQVEMIRALHEETFIDTVDFLEDVRTEAVDSYTKLRNLHSEFSELIQSNPAENLIYEKYISTYGDYTLELDAASDVLDSAKMILETCKEIAKERGIDTSPPEDHTSTSTPSIKLTSISISKDDQPAVVLVPSSNPIPLPRRLSATIPPSSDPKPSILHPHPNPIHPSTIHPHPDPIQPSIISNPSEQSIRHHPVNTTIHPPGFHPIQSTQSSHPSHPQLQLISPAVPPPPGFTTSTLYQQAAISGRVDPPMFHGDLTAFKEFHDTFEALFGTLDDITKLALLTSCLGPEPKRLVSGLRRIDRNYPTAVIILKKEYGQESLIRHTLLSRLRMLPQCDEHGVLLRETYMNINQLIHQLLPEDSDDSSEILSNLVLSKLPPSLQCRVFMDHANKDQPIRAYDILNMVASEVERERIAAVIKNGSVASFPRTPPDPPPPLPDTDRKPSTRMRDSRSSTYCRLCHRSGHYPDNCDIYTTIRDRTTVVIQRCLCRRCLGSNHSSADCKTPRTCRICKGTHHTAICDSSPALPTVTPSSTLSHPRPQVSSVTKNKQIPSPDKPVHPAKAVDRPAYVNLAFDAFDNAIPELRYDDFKSDDDDNFL